MTQPPPADTGGHVDFAEICHLLEVSMSVRSDPDAVVRSAWAGFYDSLDVVALPASSGRYLIGTLSASSTQEIVIRGTANAANVLTDLRFAARRNERLGILLHEGFESAALDMYRDLVPRLCARCDLVLYGHSAGGAEAVILAALLRADGYHVARIYTGGQPRFTDTEGGRVLAGLPILRVINDGDLVPYLPPRGLYQHFGDAVVLLDGPYYCFLDGGRADDVMSSEYSRTFASANLSTQDRAHSISGYLGRARAKLVTAVQVPFDDREKFLTPPPPPPPSPPPRGHRRGPAG